MPNSTIIERILDILTAYERGEVGLIAVVDAIELHEGALESISAHARYRLRMLCPQMLDEEERELLGGATAKEAIEELRLLLQSIKESSVGNAV